MRRNGDKQRPDAGLTDRLAERGLRSTPQREHVYQVLLQRRDHPTAEQVFLRAKGGMPEISMATVYNCLDALVKCRLVREVKVDCGAKRYCPNMREHGHFCCEECGAAYDVELPRHPKEWVLLPRGFEGSHYEVFVRGRCPECASRGGQ